MAVYTEVGDAELEAFLAEYDIGQADSFKGVAEGVENSNFLLTTTKGPLQGTLKKWNPCPVVQTAPTLSAEIDRILASPNALP